MPRLKYGSLLHDFVFEFVHDRAPAVRFILYDLCVCALQAATYDTDNGTQRLPVQHRWRCKQLQ